MAGLKFVRLVAANFFPPPPPISHIYVKSDGNVEPSTAPIQRVGNVYTLTSNVVGNIVVQKDNIVIDGAGSALQGDGNGDGIELQGRNNVTIRNIEITQFFLGINLNESSQVTITRNNITSNQYGIVVHIASNNTISQNIITTNFVGIELEGYYTVAYSSRYNVISGNFIAANVECGIFLHGSVSNSIVNNIIANNGNGTYIFAAPFGLGSSNNTIHHNNFIGNVQQNYDTYWEHGFAEPMSINFWDNGKEGNYWSNYAGKDANGDGIGDTPYIIDGNNQDNYPLMNPVVIPDLPPIPTPRPSPTMIVAAIHIIATGVAITLGVVIYRRKRLASSKTP
jgi:parallel beta-helix repeat protein